MRIGRTIGTLAVGALIATGCGSSKKFANRPPPALPRNLTVYISNSRVSVSPATVGAGPVVFQITNQSSKAQSLSILPSGGDGGQALATTGPITPQATAQIAVDFHSSGDYSVTTRAGGGSTDASLAQPTAIAPATVHVGPPRKTASGQLMVP